MKNKIAAIVAGVGGLCALCCVVPIMGFIGLGALEAFFCDSPWAIAMGVGLMAAGLGYLGYKYVKGFCSKKTTIASCSIGCGCKNA